MKRKLLLGSALFVLGSFCHATTVTIRTPNDADNGTVLSPRFGILVNCDNLTPYTALASNAYTSSGVSSIVSNNSSDPLMVYPYSSQSAPYFVSTANYLGGVTVTFTNLTNIAGIGVEESDGAAVTLEALGATGNVLGTFNEVVPTAGNTPYNAYYVLQDPTNDIKSLEVISAGSFGVDDLQFAPEPMSFLLGGSGLGLLALLRFRRRRA